MESANIWRAFKNGDWEAYTTLYDEYFSVLNNYGYKFTRDIAIIEDSIQDLFIKLWTNRSTLGDPLSIKNYLYKAFRNTLFVKLKSASRFSVLDSDEFAYPFEISFDQTMIREEEEQAMQETIKEVLNKLPPRQKEIVYLRFYEALSYEEVAEVMAIDVKSVYKLWYKATENLKENLRQLVIYFMVSTFCLYPAEG